MSHDPEPVDPLSVLLHTAARRYCIEQHAHWVKVYTENDRGRSKRTPYFYTDRDLATFPRYNVLAAIQLEVERMVPEALPFAELRAKLLRAGYAAHTEFTKPPNAPISEDAMEVERDAFCAYVESLDDDILWRVPRLPHSRVLGDEDAEAVRADLKRVWQVDGYWYPLCEITRTDVRAFQRGAFERDGASAMLRRSVERRAIDRLWRVEELGLVFEIEPESFDVDCGAEAFWTSRSLDWIVYASHEWTITVGGWLLDELMAGWPNARTSGA